jgi:ring-1,2-phenylacetyl-CoA epoxidase subunit PaaC
MNSQTENKEYEENKFNYCLQIADTCLILGHRLSEWCSRAPTLEIDMALSNMALDLVGQSRNFYQLAAQTKSAETTEDDLAYLRDAHDYKNILLVEIENGDFAHTVVRQCFFAAFQLPFFQKLTTSNDPILGGGAEKAVKELSYHLRWSSEWLIRLGDGTPESNAKTQAAINQLWAFCGEMWTPSPLDTWAHQNGIAPAVDTIFATWRDTIEDVLTRANLTIPTSTFFHKGGKTGQHTERLGFLLAEMQFLQRAYPNAKW